MLNHLATKKSKESLLSSLSSYLPNSTPSQDPKSEFWGFYWFCCHSRMREIVTGKGGPIVVNVVTDHLTGFAARHQIMRSANLHASREIKTQSKAARDVDMRSARPAAPPITQ
ncbi:hypothetical protein G7Y89_g5916 [Cudoniella acicularis]|uniref:Uncharacterized protein n=1 Tax=Cudoniella acicularis TaxID=354080 RepID=A0A8H4RNQ7_9HELO|nr:hypothetical protein G7Y89_g5916 [Cudoniella acicularis]